MAQAGQQNASISALKQRGYSAACAYDHHIECATPRFADPVARVCSCPCHTNKTAATEKALLPTEAKERKRIPLYSGLVKYFPDALIEVAKLSFIGNEQHNPGEPLHWAREKSTDQEDTLMRHLFESGTVDTDGIRHSAKMVWRALAILQLELEGSRK